MPTNRPARLGVLISGGGTTLVNLVREIDAGRLAAEIGLVIASRPDCGGIERATEANLPCDVISRSGAANVEGFSNEVFARLRQAEVDLVILGGFLSLLHIPDDFQYRVLNIHPSLIPAFCGHGFYGHKVHKAVVDRGVRVTGCTVHFADNQYDHGPIILQRSILVPDDATAHEVAGLVFEAECIAYPEAIRRVLSGRMEINGRRVRMQ